MNMEMEPPHESDGSTESKENEIYVASENDSGQGLPYAPEDFPNPGDKWGWRVGKRVGVTGNFVDRYLYLPPSLQKQYNKMGAFPSKASVERFLRVAFPGMDFKAFFASFKWKIPSANAKTKPNPKGNKEIISKHPKRIWRFDPEGCKAGNITCLSLLETSDPPPSNVRACNICCMTPRLCQDCCCILCSRPVNSINKFGFVIKCEAAVGDGFICGHLAHVECGLRSYMAGTVGGSIGLDAEYYCRHCDFKTDLVPYVASFFQSCESIPSAAEVEKTLNMCVLILRGSVKPSAQTLLHQVQSVVAKLKDGYSREDIWKREVTSAVTTGELSQTETGASEVSNLKGPLPSETHPPQISVANFDNLEKPSELERRIEQTLLALKEFQEAEYRLAEDILTPQKNYLSDIYEELEKEKNKLAKCSPSADLSVANTVLERIEQIQSEVAKVTAMEAAGKGFGETSETILKILKQQFGLKMDN